MTLESFAAVQCRDYLDPRICGVWAHRARAVLEGQGCCDTGMQRSGPFLGDLIAGPDGADRYFAAADHYDEIRERVFGAGHDPIGALCTALAAAWPGGCRPGEFGGRRMVTATLRSFSPGGYMSAHVDRACEPVLKDLGVRRRLAVNIFLEAPGPNGGGQLELWSARADHPPLDPERDPAEQNVRRCIGPPNIVLTPSTGDLFLFDSERLHAVTPVVAHGRMTLSCFVGVGDERSPLILFA